MCVTEMRPAGDKPEPGDVYTMGPVSPEDLPYAVTLQGITSETANLGFLRDGVVFADVINVDHNGSQFSGTATNIQAATDTANYLLRLGC